MFLLRGRGREEKKTEGIDPARDFFRRAKSGASDKKKTDGESETLAGWTDRDRDRDNDRQPRRRKHTRLLIVGFVENKSVRRCVRSPSSMTLNTWIGKYDGIGKDTISLLRHPEFVVRGHVSRLDDRPRRNTPFPHAYFRVRREPREREREFPPSRKLVCPDLFKASEGIPFVHEGQRAPYILRSSVDRSLSLNGEREGQVPRQPSWGEGEKEKSSSTDDRLVLVFYDTRGMSVCSVYRSSSPPLLPAHDISIIPNLDKRESGACRKNLTHGCAKKRARPISGWTDNARKPRAPIELPIDPSSSSSRSPPTLLHSPPSLTEGKRRPLACRPPPPHSGWRDPVATAGH